MKTILIIILPLYINLTAFGQQDTNQKSKIEEITNSLTVGVWVEIQKEHDFPWKKTVAWDTLVFFVDGTYMGVTRLYTALFSYITKGQWEVLSDQFFKWEKSEVDRKPLIYRNGPFGKRKTAYIQKFSLDSNKLVFRYDKQSWVYHQIIPK